MSKDLEINTKSTSENLKTAITTHLNMLDEVIKSSRSILAYSEKGDVQRLEAESNNRQRVINIVEYVQTRIEKSVKVIPPSVFNEEISQTLNNWQKSLGEKIQEIADIDNQLMRSIEANKNQIKDEISSLQPGKKSMKGYHSGNVKR